MSALAKLFSKLAKEIEHAPIKKGKPDEWANYLRNRGVKQEELQNFEKRAIKDANYPADRQMTKEEALEQFRVLGDVPVRETRLTANEEMRRALLDSDPDRAEFISNHGSSLPGLDSRLFIPKYGSEYSLSGAPEDAYEELVLHSPWADKLASDPSHYTDVPGGDQNIGWLRYNLRKLEDDNNLFHLDELQSARHQAGQRSGYRSEGMSDLDEQNLRMLQERAFDRLRELDYLGFDTQGEALGNIMRHDDWLQRWPVDNDIQAIELQNWRNQSLAAQKKRQAMTPDAPFKKNWPELLARRALLEAAEKEANLFSWTPGRLQQQRWGDAAGEGTERFYDKTLPNILHKELKAHGVLPEDYIQIKDPSGGYELRELPEPLAAIMARSRDYDEVDYIKLLDMAQSMPQDYISAFQRIGLPEQIANDAWNEMRDHWKMLNSIGRPEDQSDYILKTAPSFLDKYIFNESNKLNIGSLPAVRLTPEVRASILSKGFPKYMLPLGGISLTDEVLDEQEPEGYAAGGLVKKLSKALIKGVEDFQAGKNSIRDIEIYKNPSYRDALGIAEEDGNFALRTLYDKVGDDVYVWPADQTLHDSIIRAWLMNAESGMKRHPSDFDRGLFELQGKKFVVPKDANVNPDRVDPAFWFKSRFEPEEYASGGLVKAGKKVVESIIKDGVEFIKNPTKKEIKQLIEEDPYASARVMRDEEGNVYAFHGNEMLHDEAARLFNVPYDIENPLENSDVIGLHKGKLHALSAPYEDIPHDEWEDWNRRVLEMFNLKPAIAIGAGLPTLNSINGQYPYE